MISIKTPEEIKIMTEGGRILAEIMEELKKMIKPEITTNELNKAAEGLVFRFGARPSFKNYQGFPASLCTSINEEIVHSCPSERQLKNGDIISLDLGILYKGFHTDMAVTLPVGEINSEAKKLIAVTERALEIGIESVCLGQTLGDIGNAIQEYVESQGLSVIKDLCGHGIGKNLHEEPQILNYGKKGTGLKLVPGMVFCLEPMVALGSDQIKKTKDGYAFQTVDESLSAHFEHTLAIQENGEVKILSLLT